MPDVRLRPPKLTDVTDLLEIWQTPDVSRWWPNENEASITATIEEPDDDLTAFVIEVDAIVAGFLQVYEEKDPDYRHAGIDLMLSPALRGRGLGPMAIRQAIEWAAQRGHHRLVIDPDAANSSAIRAYEKAGFEPVGVMRRYNFDHTLGKWTDGLLMELLVDEWESPGDDPEL